MLACAEFADGALVNGFIGCLLGEGFVMRVVMLFMSRMFLAGGLGYQPYLVHFTGLFKMWLNRRYVHEDLKLQEMIGGTKGI